MASHYTLVIFAIFCLICCSHCQMKRANLINVVNTNGDDEITITEVTNFYNSFGGGSDGIDRCEFERGVMAAGGNEYFASALFDFLQQAGNGEGPWNTLTLQELTTALLGNNEALSVTAMEERLNQLYQRMDNALNEPHKTTEGQNGIRYNQFQLEQFANQADANGNGMMSQDEISRIMRSFDTNGDGGVQRCEFVNQMMTRYSQAPLTANNLFNELFISNEITWADVDTAFLLRAITGLDNANSAEKIVFVDYFRTLNERAAGIIQESDGGIVVTPPNQASTLLFKLYNLAILFVVAIIFRQ